MLNQTPLLCIKKALNTYNGSWKVYTLLKWLFFCEIKKKIYRKMVSNIFTLGELQHKTIRRKTLNHLREKGSLHGKIFCFGLMSCSCWCQCGTLFIHLTNVLEIFIPLPNCYLSTSETPFRLCKLLEVHGLRSWIQIKKILKKKLQIHCYLGLITIISLMIPIW